MKFEMIGWTAECAGRSATFSPIGDTLDSHLSEYGESVQSILVIAFVPAEIGTLTAEEKKSFGKLPKITFRRQKRHIEIRFLSSTVTAQFEGVEATEDSGRSNAAMPEVAAALAGIESKLKATDDFDFSAFYGDVCELLRKPFASVQDLQEARSASREKEEGSIPTADSWESPDVDWDHPEYHSKARSILDRPFYWSRGAPFAPHGSDTGSDVLTMYEARIRGTRKGAVGFFKQILNEWDLPEIDWSRKDNRETQMSSRSNETKYRVASQVALAAAFAEIKYRAKCSREMAEIAIHAVEFLSESFAAADIPITVRADHQKALSEMRQKLKQFAER